MEDIKENLINELADAFVSGEGAKKDSEGSRFNKATGTLIASNTFINYVCDTGKEIRVNINDPDFSFKINPRKAND